MASPENYNILHTESLTNTMACREKLIEVFKSRHYNKYTYKMHNTYLIKIPIQTLK